MKLRILILACLLLSAFGANAFAAVTYATSADYVETSGVSAARSFTENALGSPDASPYVSGSNINFMSLGQNGSAVYGFGTQFDTSVTVYETTWGTRTPGYAEYAEVLGSTDGDTWTSLGYVNNQSYGGTTLGFGGVYSYLMISDITATASAALLGDVWVGSAVRGDGFDVNAVSVQATPIPGAVWLLGTGLVGLLGLRRRMA